MAVALLGAGSVANAGQWKLKEMLPSGHTIWPEQDNYNSNESGYSMSAYHGSRPFVGSLANGGGEGYVGSDNGDGPGNTTTKPGSTLTKMELGGGTAVFEWEAKNSYGQADNSTPPPYLFVKITSTANGLASSYVSSEGGANPEDSATLTVNNGYEAAEIEKQLSEGGETRTATGNITTSRLFRFASYGASIINVPLPAVAVIAIAKSLLLPYTYYYYGTYPMTGYRATRATFSSSATISAKQDNRGVSLSRPGAIGETYDEATNTTTGDTTYSHWDKSHPFVPGTWHDNWQTIQANYTGPWSNTVEFSWSPPGSSDTKTSSQQRADRGQLAYTYSEDDLYTQSWQGTPDAPSTRAIVYNAKDLSDGATAVPTYNLTFHNEVEKDSETTTVVTVSGPLWGSNPNTSDDTLWVLHGPEPSASKTFTRGRSSSSGWSFSAGSESEIPFGKIKIPLGITGEYSTEHSTDMSGSATSPEVAAGYYVYPIFTDTYNRKTVYFRHYTPAGQHVLTVSNSPWPDDHPLHKTVGDQYVGSDIGWSIPVPNSETVPVYNPNDPPPSTPDP